MRSFLTLAFLLGSFVGSMHAADLNPPSFEAPPEPPPVVAPPPDFEWSSPYLGLHAGYGIGKVTLESFCEDQSGENFPGGRVGGFAGRNWTTSSGFVLGVEGDVGYDWNGRAFNGAKEVGTSWTTSARLRLGQKMGDGLFYLAGGWTGANIYLNDPDDSKFAHGWTLGAGIDWAISKAAFVRAEYRFNSFEKVGLRGIDTQFNQSAFNIGIGVKF